jgi:hypothetical protein
VALPSWEGWSASETEDGDSTRDLLVLVAVAAGGYSDESPFGYKTSPSTAGGLVSARKP